MHHQQDLILHQLMSFPHFYSHHNRRRHHHIHQRRSAMVERQLSYDYSPVVDLMHHYKVDGTVAEIDYQVIEDTLIDVEGVADMLEWNTKKKIVSIFRKINSYEVVVQMVEEPMV